MITFNTGSQLVLGPGGQVISSGPPAFPKFNFSPALLAALIVEAMATDRSGWRSIC